DGTARQGKRVLIVEIGEHESISRIFGVPVTGFAGGTVYRPRAAGAPAISSMCITAQEALREYGMRTVKFKLVYNAVFENAVVRYFTAAAPGLQELHLLGKIESLHSEVMAPAPNARFDLMLLDAPATGHALALFEAAPMAMRMATMGPIYTAVDRMWRLLSDPTRTALNIVTLPEETPVTEAIELDRRATALGIARGALIVNGLAPDLFPEGTEDLDRVRPSTPLTRSILDRARSTVALRAEQDATVARFGDAMARRRLALPLLACSRVAAAEVEQLADHLDTL
ncbi:MAG: chromosome partitioning protein, partial [Vicinamibacterales bacterium]